MQWISCSHIPGSSSSACSSAPASPTCGTPTMSTGGRSINRRDDGRGPSQRRQAIEFPPGNTMKSSCLFLETRHPEGVMCCTAAVNFASVGAERALCRKCPLASLGDLPLCPNAEVYAFLRNSPTGESVEVEFACLADAIPPEARCQGSPDRFPSLS